MRFYVFNACSTKQYGNILKFCFRENEDMVYMRKGPGLRGLSFKYVKNVE